MPCLNPLDEVTWALPSALQAQPRAASLAGGTMG